MKKLILLVLVLSFIASGSFFGVKYYSFIFAKTVVGYVLRVERVNSAEAVIASRSTSAAQLFSFAVAIKDSKGEIHTASTEDRQWAVVSEGQCVEARFFPYPPWQIEKARTYFGARLERLFECEKK